LRRSPHRRPFVAVIERPDVPAFRYPRLRTMRRREIDPRPRFDAARGLLAANASASLIASSVHLLLAGSRGRSASGGPDRSRRGGSGRRTKARVIGDDALPLPPRSSHAGPPSDQTSAIGHDRDRSTRPRRRQLTRRSRYWSTPEAVAPAGRLLRWGKQPCRRRLVGECVWSV
jgi:hypothetical protein